MTRTIMRWLSLLILFLLLSGAGSAIAAEGQIYTIKKGDTLWDLSKKFIDDPYYWPNIWSKNPAITNPHLIFPGQKIRILDGRLEIIPAYAEARQPSTEPVAGQPAEVAQPEELVTIKSAGGGDGFILTDEKSLGMIVDSVDNRVLLTANDVVFVKMNDTSAVAVGDTYGLFERGDTVKHPQTKKSIGTMMNNLGFLQVTEIQGGTVVAKIGEVYREVTRGAELFEYIPSRKELTLQRGTSDKRGVIVFARDEKGTFSTNDVIFISLGSNDDVQSGNLIYLSRPRKVSDEIIKKAGHVTLPDAVLGAAVIIETKKETASAIIIKSVDASFIGDQVSVVTD
jgi:LysM domain